MTDPMMASEAALAEPAAKEQTARPRRRTSYLGKRLGFYLLVTWVAVTLNFFIPRLMPGDPATVMIAQITQRTGQPPNPATVESIRLLFGSPDQSLITQYWGYLGQLIHGDLGLSISQYPVPVADLVMSALPWTLMLVGSATALAFVIGVGLGILVGWRPGRGLDSVVTPLSTVVGVVPYFWVALLAVWIFAVKLRWAPVSGGYAPDATPGFNLPFMASALGYGALPVATIVFSAFGGWVFGQRNMMVTTLSEDYVLLARAKGLPGWTVMLRYAARNALLPSVTNFALAIGGLVGGSLLTEIVFSYPGMGFLLFDAVSNRDYPTMQAVFLLITLTVLLANFLADSLYVLLDPRTREAS
ncbi:peptide/nickel transport system permease protein [Kribbella antiqua]|uniref:Peptide/nickel transport system permease protein n=1 Tax=Kribbella antiqua TaxID=2512217 RepID=A0A4V2S2R5_9ACTN|nr:ABC transporter permease [Kribbella antiqua]TCO41480.1 peptide/nickel transport system permease protein [Kribbella antiqua]